MKKTNFNIPNFLTMIRLLLLAAFVWAASQQRVSLVIFLFALSWGLDGIDGWLARQLNQETVFGYIFDKAADRLILFVGAIVLLSEMLIPDYAILLLTKDIALLPAVSWQIGRPRAIPSLGKLGKFLSLAQGFGILWLLLKMPGGFIVTLLIAVLGGVAAMMYLRSLPPR